MSPCDGAHTGYNTNLLPGVQGVGPPRKVTELSPLPYNTRLMRSGREGSNATDKMDREEGATINGSSLLLHDNEIKEEEGST
jgi:hypothetical protein